MTRMGTDSWFADDFPLATLELSNDDRLERFGAGLRVVRREPVDAILVHEPPTLNDIYRAIPVTAEPAIEDPASLGSRPAPKRRKVHQ